METYNEIPNQPDTAYETPKLFDYLRELSRSERETMRTRASEDFNELRIIIEAIDTINSEDPNQYEIEYDHGKA